MSTFCVFLLFYADDVVATLCVICPYNTLILQGAGLKDPREQQSVTILLICVGVANHQGNSATF